MYRRALCVACAMVAVLGFDARLDAQSAGTLSGRLRNSLTGEPVAAATVQIDELRRTTASTPEGTFVFDKVPPGTYHLSIHSPGYSTRRTETVFTGTDVTVELTVDPELHFEAVTTVSGTARSQFEVFQPTAVLAGQDLTKQLDVSLGATLENQPGVAARSLGPAPARPVVRGLDGDRVQILQDGQRMGDLSSQSGDHGVSVNPAAATRIEVVRGPATLLYGANAIGGLVNVITEDIPVRPITGHAGTLTLDLGSAAAQATAAADVRAGNGTFAIHAGGGGARSGDVQTPLGELQNSQSRSGFGTFGAAWTRENAYVGASYGYDNTRYGVPIIESGQVELTPRRHSFAVRAGAQALAGPVDSYRATLSVRRYRHDELAERTIGTQFTNDTEEVELMASHRAAGRLKGSFGGSFLDRRFGVTGEEALAPNVDQRGLAAFIYEEATWPHITFQFGGRVDHTRYVPLHEPSRTFTSGSGSLGVLLTPAAANERLTFAVSLARAARNPALEELFYLGPHPGNFAFEIGNPALTPEHALGFDVSMRWRGARASGEVTYFRNAISDFVFRSPVASDALTNIDPIVHARFPDRDVTLPDGNDVPVVNYIGADSVLTGIEAHGDVGITPRLFAEFALDYVRGTLSNSDQPLPRMPPLRGQLGLRYQYNAFQAGSSVIATGRQDRLFAGETETAGYALVRVYVAYSRQSGRLLHTVTARVDNAGDRLYRNHLSLIKDMAPEIGRNFKLIYNVKF